MQGRDAPGKIAALAGGRPPRQRNIVKRTEVALAIKISVREDEPLESVLKRFKRICDKEGIKKALKQYSYYEKPSDRRRRKEKERLRNIRKQTKAKLKAKAKGAKVKPKPK